ncbi:MAG: hypothetical protein PVJ11_01570 [Syntrophobacterales bacterium]|jgi:hypothetical protein
MSTKPGYFMNDLLRPRIWPSFLASSSVGSCDVPVRYGNRHPAVARWHTHLRGLATAIHEISGLSLAVNISAVALELVLAEAERLYGEAKNSL